MAPEHLNILNGSDSLLRITDQEIWTPGRIVFLVLIIILMGTTIVGNGLIVAAWFVHKPVRTPSNLLLVSLAIPDFLLGAFSMPTTSLMAIYKNWFFGPFICQVWAVTNVSFSIASANHLVLIALDRYFILTYGIEYLQHRTRKSAMASIAFVWFIGLCMSSPYIFDMKIGGSVSHFAKDETTWVCFLNISPIHVLYRNVIIILIPLVLMIYLYVKIYLGIKARLRKNLTGKVENYGGRSPGIEIQLPTVTSNSISGSDARETDHQGTDTILSEDEDTNPANHESHENDYEEEKLTICIRRERRAARTLGILIACFTLLWLPFVAVSILQAVFGIVSPRAWFLGFVVLGWINSAVNPIIYAIHNKDFKMAFKKMG